MLDNSHHKVCRAYYLIMLLYAPDTNSPCPHTPPDSSLESLSEAGFLQLLVHRKMAVVQAFC